MRMIRVGLSFANCLRHAFMSGAGYGDLERISEDDLHAWVNYDPSGASFTKMEIVLEMPKHAHNLAQWVEAALQCKTWHWDGDQYDAALSVLNDYRASIGEQPYTPPVAPPVVGDV